MGAFSYYKAHGLYNIFLLFFFQDEEEEGSWKNRKNILCKFSCYESHSRRRKNIDKILISNFWVAEKMGKVDQNSVSKHNRLNNRSFGKGIEKMVSIMNT